jgi:hypothetical protein
MGEILGRYPERNGETTITDAQDAHTYGLLDQARKQRAKIKDQQQVEMLRKAKEERGL